MKKIWIVGCGDIGRRLVGLYQSQKHLATIKGLVSSKASCDVCTESGVDCFVVNLDDEADIKQSLFEEDFAGSQLFYFAPPPSEGKQDTRLVNFFNSIDGVPQRTVLISTTGVYGDSQGNWIDENSTLKPTADRAYRRLSAEKELQNRVKKAGKAFMILRVPGIYAKDRLPLSRLKKGLPVVKASEAGFTNRIHANDLAKACMAAMVCTHANQIINICDGNPSTITDYFNQVANYVGLPKPPQISMQEAERTLSEGMVSYLKESRRIRNDKMLELLDFDLEYSSLEEGLS